jgi:two-component system, OmpR family, KDP operon response regulator KdpE
MTTVLLIDDDPDVVRALRTSFTARGYQVITAADGATALRTASETKPNLVLLELGLPDMDGRELIAGLRGWTTVPIIVLSRRPGADDKIRALDAGADDYVTKPFGMEELLARVRALLRRAVTITSSGRKEATVDTSSFTIDLLVMKVWRDGIEVHLTPTEWRLLEILVRNHGRLVTRTQLLEEVWGPDHSTDTHYLRVYLSQLRRKLEPQPAHPRHLITEPGIGYRFSIESAGSHTESTSSTSPVRRDSA